MNIEHIKKEVLY